jgi:hypothetical protein
VTSLRLRHLGFAALTLALTVPGFAAERPDPVIVASTMPVVPDSIAEPEPARRTTARRTTQVRGTSPTFEVNAGIDGEIFPVFANYASLQRPSERKWGVVSVTVKNSTDALLRTRLSVQVLGWSDQEIQIAEMAAGDVRTYIFAPTFLPRLYKNKEIAGATVMITASGDNGELLYSTTTPVRLRSAEDMYWGSKFRYAPFIASWVTPHDERVEKALARAKEFMPGRRLPGYETWKSADEQEKSTMLQARAIYRALQAQGVSYVKSSLTFGKHQNVSQRVRTPSASLAVNSANCIDAVLLFASLFENLDMQPVVVLVPGHAYVGVKVFRDADRYLYMDVALTGRATFEDAVRSAEKGLRKYRARDITRVSVAAARESGIFPMPE